MNRFPENLSRLRRAAGYTQESLAEAMGVSRQAVSKWESGQAMPEAATLVDLADLLGCSLDQLVRQELSGLPVSGGDGALEGGAGPEDRALFMAYVTHMDRFARMMAGGVALVLAGLAALLAAYALLGENGLVVLPFFAFLSAAVFLFVWGGMTHDGFLKSHPHIPLLWTPGELDAFRKRFRLGVSLGVMGILADLALLVFLAWRAGENEAGRAWAVALFLLVLSLCVGTFVYLGLQSEKMEGPAEKQDEDRWSGVIMMGATVLFLLAGFLWDLWHPAWVVFPVGGILCGIVGALRKK